MGLSDALLDSITSIIDDIAHLYDNGEVMMDELPCDDHLLCVVSTILKVVAKRFVLPSDPDYDEKMKAIEAMDWLLKARKHIIAHIEEYYMD